jgi:bifunctional NMN adenylyltransferase/nudix hydrolase
MQQATLGVVVGRFQVPDLHSGHHHLIKQAEAENSDLLIAIGSGQSLATARNPLPYAIRREMVRAAYPKACIIEVLDHPQDSVWSARLDRAINALFPAHQVTLYGSRDSFLPHYHGRYHTKVVSVVNSQSGTGLREECGSQSVQSADFRRGIIYSQQNRLPIPYPVVDVAITDRKREKFLLGQKPTDNGKWRFVGGFVDATKDKSLEAAARREAYEETGGLELGDYTYQGSTIINDWRYKDSADVVMSSLFVATYIFGAPRATDDLSDLRWFLRDQLATMLHENHQPLLSLLNRSAS